MKKFKAGVGLLEVLLAIILFILVAAPLLGVISYSLRMDRRAQIHSLAVYTAQMAVEEAYGLTESEIITLLDNYSLNMGALADWLVPGYDLDGPLDSGGVDASYNLYELTVRMINDDFGVEVETRGVFYVPEP